MKQKKIFIQKPKRKSSKLKLLRKLPKKDLLFSGPLKKLMHRKRAVDIRVEIHRYGRWLIILLSKKNNEIYESAEIEVYRPFIDEWYERDFTKENILKYLEPHQFPKPYWDVTKDVRGVYSAYFMKFCDIDYDSIPYPIEEDFSQEEALAWWKQKKIELLGGIGVWLWD
jgi:hypothetical protein